VKAKRYLVYKNKDYYNKLSHASKSTFVFQGGAMSEQEAIIFEASDLFALSLKMREWDESAKEANIKLNELSKYKEMARNILIVPSIVIQKT